MTQLLALLAIGALFGALLARLKQFLFDPPTNNVVVKPAPFEESIYWRGVYDPDFNPPPDD